MQSALNSSMGQGSSYNVSFNSSGASQRAVLSNQKEPVDSDEDIGYDLAEESPVAIYND